MVKYLNFHNSNISLIWIFIFQIFKYYFWIYCLKIFFNVNGKAIVWRIPCLTCGFIWVILNSRLTKVSLIFLSFILVWLVPLAQVLPHPQLIFPSKTWFFWNLFKIFSCRNHLKINISHILNPNLYQINSIKSRSSRYFQRTPKATFQFLAMNFQLWFNLI